MVMLAEAQMQRLKEFIETVENWLAQNPDLAADFRLWDKFSGPLGEALAIVELISKLEGKDVSVAWLGGRKEDYDIQILGRLNRRLNIQVKSSSEGKGFRPFTFENLGNDKRELLAKELERSQKKFRLPQGIREEFDRQVDNRFVERDGCKYFWVFVSTSKNGNEFFVLNKKELKSLLRKDYERYIRSTHGKRFNYAITKDNKIAVVFKKQVLVQHKDDWQKITDNLSERNA